MDGQARGHQRRIRVTRKSASPKSAALNGATLVRVRKIKDTVSNQLWGRAAGRCEFDGCNRPLWKSPVTGEPVNIAERAHIYSFSDDGPRGNKGIDPVALNDGANLLLVCDLCHKTIDKKKDGGRYTVQLLQSWKITHEARVDLVTGIAPDKQSQVVLYGANIGHHSAPLSASATMPVLFPQRYPASEQEDRSSEFWRIEAGNLVQQYAEKIRPLITRGKVTHWSVFGPAPQPLLILLGAEFTDIPIADVYPLLREPQGWGWDDGASDVQYRVTEPTATSGPPALVISLSASITHDRITNVLGKDAAIWELTILSPHNDALRARRHLQVLRQTVRPLLDRIKSVHGQRTALHIFPAASVTAAVELGRVRMNKADMPWEIYDQVNARGGFIRALRIPTNASE